MSDHVFPLSQQQTADVTRWLEVFSKADSDDAPRGMPWGDGHRAVLGVKRIPIVTDAEGITERLGWIEQGDFGWNFTQIDTETITETNAANTAEMSK